ncbi:MAG TPA: sigma-70 family RNA polymerase sigma factor [Balneolales bacterium]|nr:sigma-70 family RNA polymerase sigma factor [Balneolales bacterium]
MRDRSEITQILQHVRFGSSEAYNQLFPLVYDHLKDIASMHMKHEQHGHTLSQTELVHEVYLKLIDQSDINWKDRAHFYAIASRCMRQILIDYARKKKSQKRGGPSEPLTYLDGIMKVEKQVDDLLNLDSALKRLSKLNKRLAEVVEYRYFGEMSIEDTAEVMGVSTSTVIRDWAKARGWLYKELKGSFS